MKEFETAYQKLSTKNLDISEEYQRQLNPYKVKKIVADFDQNLVNPIKVSFRDGKYWVFDGQHTLAALKAKNGNRDLLVVCKVYHGMEFKDEAHYFRKQNGYSTPITSADNFKAGLAELDTRCLEIQEAAEKNGFRCNGVGTGNRNIACYATVYRIYEHGEKNGVGGYIWLHSILDIVSKAWPDAPENTISKNILAGLDVFLSEYSKKENGGNYNYSQLVKSLGKTYPNQILRDSKLYEDAAKNVDKRTAMAILAVYNKGLIQRKKLPNVFI